MTVNNWKTTNKKVTVNKGQVTVTVNKEQITVNTPARPLRSSSDPNILKVATRTKSYGQQTFAYNGIKQLEQSPW